MSDTHALHPAREHVPALDGIRGLAILVVMGFHFGLQMPEHTPLEHVVGRVLGAGWYGVDLFFVLSGLLITSLLLDAKGGPGYYRAFYGRRALRIFPLYYGFLAAYLFLVVRHGASGDDHYLWQKQWWWWSYLDNWWIALVRRTEPPNYLWVGPFWSLAVEEQFYLLWPTLVLLLSRRKLALLCAAIIVGAPLFRFWLRAHHAADVTAYALTPARLDALAVGSLLAVVLRDPGLARWGRRIALTTGVAAAAVVVGTFVRHGGLWTYGGWEEGIGYTVIALAWGGLVTVGASAAPETPAGRALGAGWLRSLGKYSYAMYVFHVPIWSHVRPLLFHGGDPPVLWGSHVPATLALALLCGGITYLCALASWHLYEKHFLRLKRYFRYGGPRAMPPEERSAPAGAAAPEPAAPV
ncbi:MAG TPA: acyltransferase [Gemmatimonadaceae bacterium]|nr:acyltransferase [Gemmatimonadaceae bacterium]